MDLQQQLNGSSYFSQVTVTPELKEITNKRVPILINLNAPKSQLYNVGVGYGTFTGARLTVGVNFRRLTDTGQHFDAQLKLSSVLTGLAAKYYIPGKNPLTDSWTIGAGYQKFVPKNGESYSRTLSGGYNTKSGYWQSSYTLNYLLERYNIFNVANTNSEVLYPNANFSYVVTDDITNPTYGKSLNINLIGASASALSATDFMQGEVKAKYLFSPASFARVILRADLGYTVVHDLQRLPLTMQFVTGGLTSVRGYPDSSIGPGKYLGIASVEYQNKIVGDWSGALFYDTGTATNHIGSRLNNGAGVGVVYHSFIGPIKVYLARALNKHDRPMSVEFSIGPEF